MSRLSFFALLLFVFTVPWENTLFLPGLGTVSHLLGAVSLGFGLLSVAINGSIRKPSGMHVPLTAFVAWSLASLLWSDNVELTGQIVWTYLQLLAMVALIWNFAPKRSDVFSLVKAYILGSYVSVANTVGSFLAGQTAYYVRFAAQGFDPNDLGLLLAVGIPLASLFMLEQDGKRIQLPNLLYLLYPFAALTAIILTASRGALLASAIALTAPIASVCRRSLTLKIIYLASAAIGIYMLTVFMPASSWQRLSTAVPELARGSLNNRLVIWSAGLGVFTQHPLVGVGIGAFTTTIETSLGQVAAAHNAFISIAVETGLVGLVLFLSTFGLAAISVLHIPGRERLIWAVALLTLISGISALSWEYRKPTWVLLSIVVARAAANGGQRKQPAQPGILLQSD